ncbi:cytochrome P450 family protein [Diaporthe sp. PMI_573]|nr:cytochrome P450 family protein [Diaporthaceae sp. PMI_573]
MDALHAIFGTTSTPGLALRCAIALAGVTIIYSLIRAAISPLRSIPGPFSARFSRLWYLHKVWTGVLPRLNIDLHRKYGPVVRIAPNEYSLDDPAAVKAIYGLGTTFTKGPWYSASGLPFKKDWNMFQMPENDKHVAIRKKLAGLYTMSSLVKMEAQVDECIALVETRFREIARAGTAVDLQQWMQCYAFDVIGNITVAKRFGFLDAGQDDMNLIRSLDFFIVYAARVGIYPELHKFLFLYGAAGAQAMVKIIKFVREEMKQYATDKTIGDNFFLARALRLHKEKPDYFTDFEVYSTAAANINAGSDTTSISLTAVMWNLLKHPESLAKLRAEIDTMISNGEISESLTFSDTQKMPYLQAVVKEAIRLHPAAGLPMQRVVPKGGAQLAGQFFPEGTYVGINSWVAHRNAEVFGSRVDDFRPERWLTGDEETDRKMDRYFLTFGHGARTCLGKNISMMEMCKLVPKLVRKFDLELADPNAELKTYNVWFVKQTDLKVRVSERKL